MKNKRYTKTGATRLIEATRYSFRGLIASFKSESAIRQEFLLLFVSFVVVFLLELEKLENIVLVGTVIFLIVVELINTAVETVVDRIGFEHNELSGLAKDISSAAVFVMFLFLVLCWLYILFF